MMTMGQPAGSCPSANGPLMAQTVGYGLDWSVRILGRAP